MKSPHNFEPGQLVRLEYMPTTRSRKWRKSSLSCRYHENHVKYAIELAKQENWHDWRFVAE